MEYCLTARGFRGTVSKQPAKWNGWAQWSTAICRTKSMTWIKQRLNLVHDCSAHNWSIFQSSKSTRSYETKAMHTLARGHTLLTVRKRMPFRTVLLATAPVQCQTQSLLLFSSPPAYRICCIYTIYTEQNLSAQCKLCVRCYYKHFTWPNFTSQQPNEKGTIIAHFPNGEMETQKVMTSAK